MSFVGDPRYVQGPVIIRHHVCGHTTEMRCIETTREHVEFTESHPCLPCLKLGLKRQDFIGRNQRALTLEEIEREDPAEETGQLSVF